VFRLTFRCPSDSMKHLVSRSISSQVTAVYPLCRKQLTMSSCSYSSPPGTVLCRLKITNISSGLFITKPHRQKFFCSERTFTHTHKHIHTMTLEERLTWHWKPTNRKQEEESSSDYYHRGQIKHCSLHKYETHFSLQSTGFILWKDQVYCMEGGLNANNENDICF
jgi:hypothetical protein